VLVLACAIAAVVAGCSAPEPREPAPTPVAAPTPGAAAAPTQAPPPGPPGLPNAPPPAGATSLGTVVVADADRCGLLLDSIYFAENSAVIGAEQAPALDGLAEMFRCLHADGEITRWGVVGHADSHEDDVARLAHERSRAVARELVARGVPVDALAPESVGASQPLDPGQTAGGRARNRHVSFSVLVRRN
jgi:outer membrane protein OmpA-like peptidoglycan-associated protein